MLIILLLTFSAGLFVNVIEGQAVVSIGGSNVIGINEKRNVVCTISNSVSPTWIIGIKNQMDQLFSSEGSLAHDFSTTNITVTSSTLIVMTNRTDVISVGCFGLFPTNFTNTPPAILNLTIYGIPDPPAELNVSITNKILITSWTYLIIPTVTVTFNISLTFWSPSQLNNITKYVTDTNTHTFTLDGARSCDPFTMCITATNTVGQSQPSCVNNTLPYIPSTDRIEYSLFKQRDSYTLNLTIQMSECLKDESLFYIALVHNENEHLSSQTIPANPVSTIIIEGLSRNSVYNLTIKSNNSLGLGFSKPQEFRTNDVQGVNICSTMTNGVLNISCDYVSQYNNSGCFYQFSSTYTSINGFIIGMNYHIVSIDINTQYNITVTDISNEDVIIRQQFIFSSISSCFTTTELVPLDNATIKDTNHTVTIVAAVTTAVLILAITLAVTIIVVICLFHHDYCSGCGLLVPQKSDIEKENDIAVDMKNSPECGSNPSYGVTKKTPTQPNDNLMCDINPSYDTVNIIQDSSVGTLPVQSSHYETVQ